MNEPKKIDFGSLFRRYRGVFVGIILLTIFAFIIIRAQSVQLLVIAAIDARFWPTVVGILGCILCVVFIIQSYIIGKKVAVLEESEQLSRPKRDEKWYEEGNKRTIVTFVLLFLYVLGISHLGWILSTLLYLFFQLFILTEKENRRPLRIAIITIVFTGAIYFFFRYVFLLMLPVGKLWSIWG
jgi:putative tricarboxylic transport membrane protein